MRPALFSLLEKPDSLGHFELFKFERSLGPDDDWIRSLLEEPLRHPALIDLAARHDEFLKSDLPEKMQNVGTEAVDAVVNALG